jgi:hypothetical protein
MRYFVPGPGLVRLTLYDIHGRAVTSISSMDGGGVRELPLQSLPNVSRLASGIYFYDFHWNEVRQKGKETGLFSPVRQSAVNGLLTKASRAGKCLT